MNENGKEEEREKERGRTRKKERKSEKRRDARSKNVKVHYTCNCFIILETFQMPRKWDFDKSVPVLSFNNNDSSLVTPLLFPSIFHFFSLVFITPVLVLNNR